MCWCRPRRASASTIDEDFVAANPSVRNVGLPSGGWPAGTEGATLYTQPRTPRTGLT